MQTVLAPQYLGAIVVCQGADRSDVRLAIVEAVSALTGLGADKISVLKMK
jgi:stage III sporulation protein AG